MGSNLGCVGLAVEGASAMAELVNEVAADAALIGRVGGLLVRRWEDPSGSRLVLITSGNELVDLLPSYASEAAVHLRDVAAANEDLVIAAVVDGEGDRVTSVALELEQRKLLTNRPLAGATATITAFGQSVAVYADAEVFAASSDSLVDPGGDEASEPPPHFAEQDWPWPPRMAAESFISYGVFGEATGEADATARLNGVVLTSEVKTVQLTGQPFVVSRVRSAGFEVDLCMSFEDHSEAVPPGSVVGGHVFLVGSIPSLEHNPARRRRWLRRA